MCFKRSRCEERKSWMNDYVDGRVMDYCKGGVSL